MTASATLFDTRYRNLIDFADAPSCTSAQINTEGGCYYNVGRADARGVELSADAVLVPDAWRARASYTYLDARDLATGAQLLQRPRNKGALSLLYDGIANLELEVRLTLVAPVSIRLRTPPTSPCALRQARFPRQLQVQ